MATITAKAEKAPSILIPLAEFDRFNMELAIREARKSKAEDNRIHPKVGVVIVMDTFVGRAFRGERGGGDHAEYTALEKKYPKKSVAGATAYVTLEPCTTRNHPKIGCAEWLIQRKVKRVIIGMLDPNPQICGKGVRRLREANIDVELFPSDLMAQVEDLNRKFISEFEAISFKVPKELNRGAGANLINPYYSQDCRLLDESSFDLKTVIRKDTIIIVVGSGLVSELVDRPVAGVLRDEIDRRSGGTLFRRAVIIGYDQWVKEQILTTKRHPTISIGGSPANKLTDIISSASSNKWNLGKNLFGAYIHEGPQVALWGDNASETREAVEAYIKSPDGLEKYLGTCWR